MSWGRLMSYRKRSRLRYIRARPGCPEVLMPLSRRSFFAGTGGRCPGRASGAARAAGQKVPAPHTSVIEVGGKPATRYGVTQPSGAWGLTLDEGETFDVRLENGLDVLSGLHWHGLNPPWREDGVPYISGPPIAPGKSVDYRFPALTRGHALDAFALRAPGTESAGRAPDRARAQRHQERPAGGRVLLEDFSWTKPSRSSRSCANPSPWRP